MRWLPSPLLLLLGSYAAAQVVQFNAWNVPYSTSTTSTSGVNTQCPNGNPGGPFYNDFTQTIVPTYLNAVVIPIDAACIDQTTNPTMPPYTYSPLYSWTGFDSTVNLYISAGIKQINFSIRYVENPPAAGATTGNSFTPAYVLSQGWADQIAPAWSAYASFYANGFLGASISGTEYYFQTSTNCVTGPTEPSWTVGGGPYTDGSCTWGYVGTNAPPQDVAFCTAYTYSGALANGTYNISTQMAPTLASGFPAIWEQPFAAWVQRFNVEVITHLKGASYSSQIGYVRFGVSLGEEASTACPTQFESLFPSGLQTDAQLQTVWTGYAASTYAYNSSESISAGFTPNLMAAVNCAGLSSGQDCSWADAEAVAAANEPGYTVGSQGLQTSDLANLATGMPCSNDWCNWHNAVWGRVQFVELQECNVSNAAYNGSGSPENCIVNNNSPSSALPQLLVLAVQHSTNVIELYPNEYLCAWDQAHYQSGTGGPAGSNCTTVVSSAYSAAIAQTKTGQPSGTSSLFGNAIVIGSPVIF